MEDKENKKEKNLDFVVQKHKATRLHYDFRLRISDVLKSWAIPRGPSLNPGEKRLAIETEDHPLSYSSFEGTIAPEKYGAGEVIIWDRGKYISAENPQKQYSRGSIKFILKGIKLKGEFLLLRTEKNPGPKSKWLLIKKYDKFISYDDITKTRPSSVVSLREI